MQRLGTEVQLLAHEVRAHDVVTGIPEFPDLECQVLDVVEGAEEDDEHPRMVGLVLEPDPEGGVDEDDALQWVEPDQPLVKVGVF